ncbi:MAG TPA: hypothetical protein VGM95_03835, partial [Lactobacillaceae bacterium]
MKTKEESHLEKRWLFCTQKANKNKQKKAKKTKRNQKHEQRKQCKKDAKKALTKRLQVGNI